MDVVSRGGRPLRARETKGWGPILFGRSQHAYVRHTLAAAQVPVSITARTFSITRPPASGTMIALVDVVASDDRRTLLLDQLPPLPPAYSAVVVRCRTVEALERAVAWQREAEAVFPNYPLALVVPRDAELLRRLVLARIIVDPLVFEDELAAPGVVHSSVLHRLAERTATRSLLRELLDTLPAEVETADARLLFKLVDAGARGRSVNWLSRALGMSEPTLRRWLRQRGLPGAKTMLRLIRVRAVERMIAAGAEPAAAARLGGWMEVQAFRRAERRVMSGRDPWVHRYAESVGYAVRPLKRAAPRPADA